MTYIYDNAGRRTQMTVGGQNPVTYTHDANARLRTITQSPLNPVTLDYDAANRRISLVLPNGVSTEYQYDLASRLSALVYRNGLTTLGDLQYTYDAAGNRTATGGSFARTLVPDSVSTTSYDSANEQLAFADMTRTFDSNGNLATRTDSSGTTTYTWDARNRLTGITGPSLAASFSYDALGRRAVKTINEQDTSFQYDGLDILQESGSTGAVSYLRTLAIDEALARTDTTTSFFYLTDALGSTVALADLTGATPTSYTYAPFGDSAVTGSPNASPFQFTGRENDGTGLYYYRARYYDAAQGRFLQEDPSRAEGLQASYAYVRNRPLSFNDPLGLYSWGEFFQDWSQWADIRAAQEFWQGYSQGALSQGDWLGATTGDALGGLLGMSGLPTVQENAEIIGSIDSTIAEKIWAGGKIVAVGASWYYLCTGDEIRLGGKRKVAPFGNRTGHPYGELPHYHRRIIDPYGKTVPGGSDKWHRPWEKGF